MELDDDSEDLKDGLTIERSDRKIVSPLDKSYNMSQQQTSFNQNQNLFVTKNVDTEPKKSYNLQYKENISYLQLHS